MTNFDEIDESYSSASIDNLLDAITPEEQEQTDYKMKLSAKIHAGLKAKGWKSLDLAKALELKSPSLVSKWLSGTHNFTVDTLVAIQRVLSIKLLDAELEGPAPSLHVNFTVTGRPSALHEVIYGQMQPVIDEAGGMQPTTITMKY